MVAQPNDVIFLLKKRIISLEETRAVAMENKYYTLVRDCDRRIDENKLLIKMIEKL